MHCPALFGRTAHAGSVFTHAIAAVFAALVLASGGAGQTFNNGAPISIPAMGNATPFPSTITVTGASTFTASDIQVNLYGFTHSFPGDVRVWVTAPTGQTVTLMNHHGGGTDVVGVDLLFTRGGAQIPSPLVSGTYTGSFENLAGLNANGVWSLYVADENVGDAGSIAGGWGITIGGSSTAASSYAFSYQGRLTGGPATGPIDLRFTLWEDPTATFAVRTLAGPIAVSGVVLTDGLFTAPVDFGVPIPSNRKTWLQIEVANPSGSGFVSLSPRQPMTFTPLVNVSGLPYGSSVGSSMPAGVSIGDRSRVGLQVDFGDRAGCTQSEFNGMRVKVNAGTTCGVSEDILFFTYECNVGCSREVARINGAGNVGIGTTNPTQRLHVIGNIVASGTITPSCARLKENVEPMCDALDRLAGLSAVRFDWKSDEAKTRGFTHDLGFIAEDVARVFPEVVFRDDNGEVMGLDYARMSAVAVGAIKQLKAENDRMKSDNADLRSRLEKIEAALSARKDIR